jgi:hypothetical protein
MNKKLNNEIERLSIPVGLTTLSLIGNDGIVFSLSFIDFLFRARRLLNHV